MKFFNCFTYCTHLHQAHTSSCWNSHRRREPYCTDCLPIVFGVHLLNVNDSEPFPCTVILRRSRVWILCPGYCKVCLLVTVLRDLIDFCHHSLRVLYCKNESTFCMWESMIQDWEILINWQYIYRNVI